MGELSEKSIMLIIEIMRGEKTFKNIQDIPDRRMQTSCWKGHTAHPAWWLPVLQAPSLWKIPSPGGERAFRERFLGQKWLR